MGQKGRPFFGREIKNYVLLFKKHGGHQCAMLPIFLWQLKSRLF